MRKIGIVLLLLSAFCLQFPAAAQDNSASWEAIVVYGTYIDMNLGIINQDGLQAVIPLPAQRVPWLTAEGLNFNVRISPDHRYVISAPDIYSISDGLPAIVDTQTQLANTNFAPEDFRQYDFFSLGAISPDGTQFAFSYGNLYDSGTLQIYDLASGELVQQKSTDTFLYLLNQWDENGMLMNSNVRWSGIELRLPVVSMESSNR